MALGTMDAVISLSFSEAIRKICFVYWQGFVVAVLGEVVLLPRSFDAEHVGSELPNTRLRQPLFPLGHGSSWDPLGNDPIYIFQLVAIDRDRIGQAWTISGMSSSGPSNPVALCAMDGEGSFAFPDLSF